jgi:hypothetical protein
VESSSFACSDYTDQKYFKINIDEHRSTLINPINHFCCHLQLRLANYFDLMRLQQQLDEVNKTVEDRARQLAAAGSSQPDWFQDL